MCLGCLEWCHQAEKNFQSRQTRALHAGGVLGLLGLLGICQSCWVAGDAGLNSAEAAVAKGHLAAVKLDGTRAGSLKVKLRVTCFG